MAAADITTPKTEPRGILHAEGAGPLLTINPDASLEDLLGWARQLLSQASGVAETVCSDLYEVADLPAQHRGDALEHLLGTIDALVSAAQGKV